MVIGKKDHLVGLDIGSHAIKVAEVSHTKSGRALKKFGMLELPSELIEDGVVKDIPAVSDLVRSLFKTHGIKEKKVAISVGGYSIIVKKINVQTMTEEQLLETIHFEAEQYIPFDINDVNLDFQILGENESTPNQMSVLLVAAKKDLIADYIELVETVGRKASIIDVDAFALQNIYESSYFSPEETTSVDDGELVTLIDIGASKTSLNILKGTASLFMRDISMGCGQITLQIASQIDCSLEEAEQIKGGSHTDKISPEKLTGILSSFTAEWATEVRRALDFFYSSFGEDQINRIILSGGGTHVEEFRQLLAADVTANIETINPFGNIDIDDNKFDPSYLEQIAPQAAIAMGLALRRVDDK